MTQPAEATDTFGRDVRLYVFGKAANTGRVPQPPEIAAALGRSQAEVEQALIAAVIRRLLRIRSVPLIMVLFD